MTDTERLQRQDDADFKEVIRSPAGMRFIAALIDLCGAHRQSFEGDVNGSLFREGQRSIGLYLLSQLHERGDDEAAYYKAAAERNELRRKDARDLRVEMDQLMKGDRYGEPECDT